MRNITAQHILPPEYNTFLQDFKKFVIAFSLNHKPVKNHRVVLPAELQYLLPSYCKMEDFALSPAHARCHLLSC